MKTKGITLFERHGEKAVVGVFAVLALGVVAWQFVGAGNRVTTDTNQKVEPDRAYESITRKAQQIAGQLADPNPAPGIPESVPDAAAIVRQRLSEGLTRADQPLPVALGPSTTGARIAGISDDARYAAVTLPALRDVAVAQYLATLNPLAVADSPALAAIAPAQQPYDVRAVSVQATFPAAQLRAALQADPDGDGPLSPLPRTFWLNRTAILDVRLERQRMNADGSFGPAEAVPASPRAQSYAGAVSPSMNPGEFQNVARDARAAIASVVQPAFPPTIAGDAWTAPANASIRDAGPATPPEMASLMAALDRVERELTEQRAALERATSEQGRANINNRIAALTSEKDRIEVRLVALDEAHASAAQSAGASASGLPEPRNIESADEIAIVAHDFTARPGETYRYRLSLGVANPFFPFATALKEDQRDLAAEPILYTEPTEWSAPVRVAPPAQVFFTRVAGGQDASAVGGYRVGDASAEVYGLYYGHWRGSASRLAPGDTLAGSITLPQGLKIFEIGEAQQGAGGPVVVGEQPAPQTFSVALDGAMLVDVVEKSAGAARPSYLAVVRLPDGRLVLRDPAIDQQDPAFAAARASAAQGAVAGEVKIQPVERRQDQPAQQSTERQPAGRDTRLN